MKKKFQCYVCGGNTHSARQCPESWKNKKENEESTKEKVLWTDQHGKDREENLERKFIEGVLDTGCNTTLCGEL
jgi:hypothetical protein